MKFYRKLRQWPIITRLSLFTLCLAATITALAWKDDAVNTRLVADTTSGSSATPAMATLPAPAQESPKGKFRVERVTVLPYGFEPEQITRPAGPFLLAVDNRAGTDGLSLRLLANNNQLVLAQPIYQGRPGAQKEINLAPGTYLLAEENHPEWSCVITITAQ